MPMFSVDEVEANLKKIRDGEAAKRELASTYRNVKDIYEAIGDAQIIDAQLVKRLLGGVLPWEMR